MQHAVVDGWAYSVDAAQDADIRVAHESGEDYLYPADRFVMVKRPRAVQDCMLCAAEGLPLGLGAAFNRPLGGAGEYRATTGTGTVGVVSAKILVEYLLERLAAEESLHVDPRELVRYEARP